MSSLLERDTSQIIIPGVPRDLHERLKRLAAENDRSLAAEARRALREHVEAEANGGGGRERAR